MTLALTDKWLWDFWLVDDGARSHAFYLQAPRSLGDPNLRHWNVTIGHAVSSDLERWEVLPDAFGPGPPGSWDDLTTWTGSIIRHDGRWNLLYTGTSRSERGLVQRIGLATSDDLIRWERHAGGPVLEADPRWYELLDSDVWHDQAWRDPWVFHDPADGAFHAYVTARASRGDPRSRGVVAHARSRDLVEWDVLPPVTEPFGFGQLEVPQLVAAAGHRYLLFSSDTSTQSAARQAEGWGTGTFALRADSTTGCFPADSLARLDADALGSTYAGKIVSTPRGLRFLAWEGAAPGDPFRGVLSSPRAAIVAADGNLAVAPR